ncbi:hypothetical protein [Hymenobacter antarcticus]|uniref:DUF748 domain-containing protein n=1 Tax=Hymenobacter antarcticus TaxID=486270 RepID=A0ABP7PG34_9BACT
MPETISAANSAAAAASSAPETPTPRPRHWGRWLLGGLALVAGIWLALTLWLDPWLKRQLEQQVTRQTHGQYRLQVGELRTSLWQRAVRLSGVRLRPAATVADTLPRIRLDVARLNVTGIGLLALLRKAVVPLDSVVLDSVKIELLALATQPTKNAGKPLHERLPLKIKGLKIGYLGLLHTQASYRPSVQPTAQVQRADLSAHDLLITAAGAADTQRLGYAANWDLLLRHAQGAAAGHRLSLAGLSVSTADQRIQLDSGRVRPIGATQPGQARVDLSLPRLRIAGLRAAALQRKRAFWADSLLIESPQLTANLPTTGSAGSSKSISAYLRSLDLAHLAVRKGFVRVTGAAPAPVIHELEVAATGLHLDSAGAPDTRRIFFAKAWNVALGASRATVAAHVLTLKSLRLSTTAGTFELRAVRIQPPAPGQGKPGAVRVDLLLPSLALTGWNALALAQQHFQAASLVLDRPNLKFTPPAQPPPPVWKLVSKFLRRTDLAQLRVRHAEFEISGLRHLPQVRDLNLTGRAIRIDSLAALTPSRIAYARGWQANSGRITAPFDPPYYLASSQRARLDTDAQTFRFEDLALTPKYSPVAMNQHKGYQAPAITIKLPVLALSGLDFAGLVRRADVRAARVLVQRPVVRIRSDGRGPINPNMSKISPEEMLKLSTIIDIRRLDLRDGNLYSSYRSPLTPIPGRLSINRFNGSFYNLSNDRRRQTAATPLTGKASTYLQNRTRLDAQVSMYVLDPKGRHRVWGAFGAGPFAILNPMTVPTRLVKFKKGEVQRIRFDLQASRKGTTGTMWAEYSGLQLELLGYKNEEIKKPLLKRVISKVANVVVIRDQNPRKRGELVTGEMTSTREPRFSVFTLWRQGVVSGLFHSIGVPQKIAQKLSESKDEAPLPK